MVLGGRYEVKPSGCWEFQGSRHNQGYGRVKREGRVGYAHREAWVEANGPIPSGLHVLHKCDNPPCINPAHLFLGTHADNMADMARKGRIRSCGARGVVRRYGLKLTPEKAVAIRKDRRKHEEIARDFGVSRVLVTLIKSGKKWRHAQ